MEFWKGQRVRLRAVEPNDWEIFAKWNRDSEVARMSYAIPFPKSGVLERKHREENALSVPAEDVFRFVIENLEGEPVGTVNTHSCDQRNGTFKYGLAIGRDHWRKGYAREAITLVLKYFFQELRYQKATVHVYEFNPGSVKLHESLGFQLEGRLRRMVYTQGEYHDELVYGLTVDEFSKST